jgi:putative addiction module CopG family antidote
MKLSVSLPEEDVRFVDEQARTGVFESRSAAIHGAIRLLRDRQHVDSYAAAWDEWDGDDGVAWDTVTADGLG